MGRILTLGEVADQLGCRLWQVRRLYERGLVPPAMRVRGMRVIYEEQMPAIKMELQKAGYLGEKQQ